MVKIELVQLVKQNLITRLAAKSDHYMECPVEADLSHPYICEVIEMLDIADMEAIQLHETEVGASELPEERIGFHKEIDCGPSPEQQKGDCAARVNPYGELLVWFFKGTNGEGPSGDVPSSGTKGEAEFRELLMEDCRFALVPG